MSFLAFGIMSVEDLKPWLGVLLKREMEGKGNTGLRHSYCDEISRACLFHAVDLYSSVFSPQNL